MNEIETMGTLARLLDAINFSAQKHRVQRRKDVEESAYINHPIAVASVLLLEGGIDDIATLQAAILHDTVEDTQTSYEELVGRFGKDVADVVMELTDDKSLPKAERKLLQVTHAHKKSSRAVMVKLADKTCNLRDIVDAPPDGWTVERKREYFDWAKQVVDALPFGSGTLRDVFNGAYSARP